MSSDSRSSPDSLPFDEHYFPGERMAAPPAVETFSETVWNEFNQLQAAPAAADAEGFAPTVPGGMPDLHSNVPLVPAPPVSAFTAHDAMVEARRFNRVCPKPAQWQQLYDMLPGKVQQGRTWQPPAPITGPAWAATPAMAKRMCLRDHIEWAEHHGALDEVMRFLKALPEDQWHHMGE